ncbi:hypothetical protein ASZ90_009895 [hydrocarbon metagenome]|uniref:Uncharacterized protein n=1 Tax=hydrocarbon metagenome TaxID=938273 RepID=A0A0W8FHI8_9ZZZZ
MPDASILVVPAALRFHAHVFRAGSGKGHLGRGVPKPSSLYL